MNHTLRVIAIGIVSCLAIPSFGQDAYIDGSSWYGHEVDSCFLDFEKIRKEGDPNGVFAYAKENLRTMTQFEHGQPVIVTKTREVPPEDVTLAMVRRVGESISYWTDPAALSDADPLAEQKAAAEAERERQYREEVARARLETEKERQWIEKVKASRRRAKAMRRPIALERYWQIGNERFRGKLVNANDTHVKIRKTDGKTIIINRQYLTTTSDTYVSNMLRDLQAYREFQALGSKSS